MTRLLEDSIELEKEFEGFIDFEPVEPTEEDIQQVKDELGE